MAASFDFSQHHHTAPLPHVAGVGLDRLVSLAVERSRSHLRARGQHLHVEALSAPIQVRGDLEGIVDALAQLLCAGSLSAGQDGLIFLSVMQIGCNAMLIVRAERRESRATLQQPHFDHVQCDWSAVERVVALHGGAISARSNDDGHAEYVLALLTMPDESGAIGRRVPWIGGPERPVCRVLVVDDSPDSADSMACLLSIRGHEVHVAYDGSSAFDKVMALRPDVVLLDIALPGMDGIEVAQAVRARAEGRCPIFIAVSGYGECSAMTLFDLHLTKPIDPIVLLQSVEHYAGVAPSLQPQA
jgi:CheY-like chemotaxis protein